MYPAISVKVLLRVITLFVIPSRCRDCNVDGFLDLSFKFNCVCMSCLLLICLHLTIIIDLLCNSYIGTITRSASIADVYSSSSPTLSASMVTNVCMCYLCVYIYIYILYGTVSMFKIGDGICSQTMKAIDFDCLLVCILMYTCQKS